jgi:UDP-N-acetylmuramate-alanine ligase
MKKITKVHFVGIKGVGMAPLAIVAKEADLIVSGCDLDEQFITDEPLQKAKIKPLIGF